MSDYDPDLPPPLYTHPPWFYRVVAACLIVLTLVAVERCSAF
jgi:hypothetical protein